MPGFELIGKEEREAVNEVFDKGGILFRHSFDKERQGVYKVDEFEREFARKLNVRYARAVTSGTAALKVALKALDIKPGDEVITQSHTFVATVEAIIDIGAVPILTEVNKTLNMDPEDLKAKITDKTRAIIPVHMLGVPCQMQEIVAIAREKGIPILEDNAQATGGEYKGKKLGTIGEIGIFSFDFAKPLTTGEGGMVVTNDKELYLRAKEYSDHGHESNPNFPRGEDTRRMGGFNYNMMELQGAIGLAQLKKLDFALARQRENKRKLKEGLQGLSVVDWREIPDEQGEIGDTLVFFLKNESQMRAFTKRWQERGFGTKNLPSALKWHFSDTWNEILKGYERYQDKDLRHLWPKSAELLYRTIALPVMIKMTEEQIDRVVTNVKEILKEL